MLHRLGGGRVDPPQIPPARSGLAPVGLWRTQLSDVKAPAARGRETLAPPLELRRRATIMRVPDFFDQVPRLRVRDPLADFLGAAEGGPLDSGYADTVKLAGHSYPTVATAYVLGHRALSLLYRDAIPERGERLLLDHWDDPEVFPVRPASVTPQGGVDMGGIRRWGRLLWVLGGLVAGVALAALSLTPVPVPHRPPRGCAHRGCDRCAERSG
jgi:hypothetical protein